jgi:hypothetical protein
MAMPMKDLEPLLEEYKALFAYQNSNALVFLNIPPVILTVVAGLAMYSKEVSPLLGLGIALTMFTMIIWMGYCHSLVNGNGLKLVDIEQRINRYMEQSKDVELSFHSEYVGQGLKILPGYYLYSVLLLAAFCCVLVGALTHFWGTLTSWSWSCPKKVLAVALPGLLNILALGNMFLVERKTQKLRQMIIVKYAMPDRHADRNKG